MPILPKPRINHQIRAAQVRLIDEVGENIGVVSLQEALGQANKHGLDLVEIAPLANPPVAKIIDFGKYLYQQEKQLKKQRAKHKTGTLKAIKVGLRIGEHDALIKVKKVEEFLADGDKVKIEMFLRGRERANIAFAHEKFQNFLKLITTEHKVEQPLKKLPSGFIIIISK